MNSDNQTDATDSSAPSTVITVIDEDWSLTSEDLSDSSSDENDLDPRSELMNAFDAVEKKLKKKMESEMKTRIKILKEEVEKKQDEAIEKDRKLEGLEKEMRETCEKKDQMIVQQAKKMNELEESRNELSKRLTKQKEEAEDKIRFLNQQNEELKKFINWTMEEDSWKLGNEEKAAQKDMEKKKQELAMRKKRILVEMNSKDGGPSASKKAKNDI